MNEKLNNRRTVNLQVIIYSIIIFIGVLILILGKFYDNTIMFYIGIFIILAGVPMNIIMITVSKKS